MDDLSRFTHLLQFRWQVGTRPHPAHFTLDHVQDLWKFIETGFAQEAPHTGDPRIILQLVVGLVFLPEGYIRFQKLFQLFLSAFNHGAEFIDVEDPASPAQALLSIYDRSW